MAELATIARPYAEALFQATRADLVGTAQWLGALGAVGADAQLLQFAGNPKVSDAQVYDLVAQVASVKLPVAGQNFLRTLVENGRLSALPEIVSQFRALQNAQSGTSDATVIESGRPKRFSSAAATCLRSSAEMGKALYTVASLVPLCAF